MRLLAHLWPLPCRLCRASARLAALAALLLCLAARAGSEDQVRFAVLHPDTDSAPGAVFRQMLNGINNYPSAEVLARAYGEEPNAAELSAWANAQNPTSMILLGNQSLKLASQITSKVPLVVGGVLKPPAGASGVSILGDPVQFFTRLRSLAPQVRSVSVIYSPDINEWWVSTAAAAAAGFELEFRRMPASDVVTSARLYRDFLASATPYRDALWIPLHDITPMKTVLPLILRESWSRNLVVFSNNPLLAKQGILFAMYPDNEAMGTQIAQIASEAASKGSVHVAHAARLHTALNRRTAAHLGITISEPMLQQFDRIYPVQ
jgi:putative ABC transport system substrate-binding protein